MAMAGLGFREAAESLNESIEAVKEQPEIMRVFGSVVH